MPNWIIYGVNEDDSREEVGSFPLWKDVVEWLKETWGITPFYGVVVMPDDEMMDLLKKVDNKE